MERIEIAFEMIRKLHDTETDPMIKRGLLEVLNKIIPVRYEIRMREEKTSEGVA
jgi:hypothetical protein